MVTGAMKLATCMKHEEIGETTNSVFEEMITKIIFGHSIAALPDITGLMIRYDSSYVFIIFFVKMMDCGTRIHYTLKRCPWTPVTYDILCV